jgi:hypothetical protein
MHSEFVFSYFVTQRLRGKKFQMKLLGLDWMWLNGHRRLRQVVKVPVSFVMSVFPSVLQHGTARFPLYGIS